MSGILSSNDTRQLNRIAASGINEKIRNLRARSGVDTILRRLLWELVQNAKDNAVISNNSCDAKVDIKIKLTEDSFVFSHNDGFFKVENIQGIIRRFSSEDKEGLESANSELLDCITGRFGTGFMTTHLLSEFVTVSGLFKDPDGKFREFDLNLDRRGKTLKELENAINQSIEDFESKIEKAPLSKFKGKDTWTSFGYELSGDGFELANKAIDGLNESLGFVLINLPLVNSISVERNGRVELFTLKDSKYESTDGLIIRRIQAGDDQSKNSGFIQKSSDNISVTIPVQFDDDGQIHPERIAKSQPRLFLDFPLVGSEVLQIPFVMNSHQFEPTEPRDGIFLAESEDDNTLRNKEVVNQAIELYLDLVRDLSSMSDARSLYNLVAFGDVAEQDWLSREWYQDEIVDYCRRELLRIPLVDTNSGDRKSIKDEDNKDQVFFPYHSKGKVTKRVWKLSNDLWPEALPNKQDCLRWSKVLWDDCLKQDLKGLSEDIQNQENLEGLSDDLGCSEKEVISWLNDYYDLLFVEGDFVSRIQANEFRVIPSRSGKLKSPNGLRVCKKLDDEIIEVCEMLDYNINDSLVYKKIGTKDKYRDDNPKSISYGRIGRESVASKMNDSFKGHSNSRNALNYLISLFAEDENFPKENELIYQASIDLLEDKIPEKTIIKNWIPEFWDYACKARLNRLVRVISEFSDLASFSEYAESRNIQAPKEWLIDFSKSLLDLGYKNKFNLKENPIVPNQNGVFKNLETLFGESEEIDESLLDIAAALGVDFRADLIDRDFSFLDIPESRKYSPEDVADSIMKAVRPLTEESPRTETTAEIFMNLIEWFDKYPSQAETLFQGLYENQHLLYSADQVKKWRDKYQEFHKRDEEITSILEKHQIKDLEELEKRLSQVQAPSGVTQKVELNDRDDLLAAGIYSAGMGESLNKHSNVLLFSKGNYTTSDYSFVKKILKRAVKNVLTYLLEDERYEFQSDIDSIMVSTETITVISGVKKNGRDINLVIRPSDGQKVHVFYGAEFNALKHENTEFWIDNGTQDPEILTIGKILEYTGTEVIPLYRIAEN
jgi:hypothetical protein